ncbi:MAG: BlaI/MecI/CopY family transcriptional regulator [Vicinamibacterales bacterium]
MARPLPRPTDAEIAILGVLWRQGPSTVRQVHEALAHTRETGYTTTLKLMQIMADKGLVSRDERSRTHVYVARAPREQTEQQLVAHLLDRAFGGSAAALVQRALSTQRASEDELREIRRLIDKYEEEQR